jgi:hypothetical protein
MDFKDITKKIAEVVLGSTRMTDIASGVYAIVSSGEELHLVSAKGEKTPITMAGLASLRIITDAVKAKEAITTRDARESEHFTNLQKAIAADAGVVLTENTKFTVAGRLRIHDSVSDSLVYKNDQYIGYPDYVKASRKAFAMAKATEDQIAARNAAFTDASEDLRKSGLKKGVTAIDANLQLLPYFTVSDK